MSCYYYQTKNAEFKFSEMDDDSACLCTLTRDTVPDARRVRALAYLGAMVALVANGELDGGEWYGLPFGVPHQIREAIDKLLPVEDE